jgi:hypothetical protein
MMIGEKKYLPRTKMVKAPYRSSKRRRTTIREAGSFFIIQQSKINGKFFTGQMCYAIGCIKRAKKMFISHAIVKTPSKCS